jgi:mRNA interferase MazF
VLVISHDVVNRGQTVIALAITSRAQRAGFPLTHRLRSGDLSKESWVKMSQVRTLSIERLRGRIGRVDTDELAEVVGGLAELVT